MDVDCFFVVVGWVGVFFLTLQCQKKKSGIFKVFFVSPFFLSSPVLSCPSLLQAVTLFVSWLIMITCGPNMVAWKSYLTSKLTFFFVCEDAFSSELTPTRRKNGWEHKRFVTTDVNNFVSVQKHFSAAE